MYGIRSIPAKTIVLTLVALGVVSLAAATAAAHDDHRGGYKKYDSDRRWHHYDQRYWKKHGHHGVTTYGWKPAYGYKRNFPGCRPVVSHGRDHFGRRAKFGGTLCYDRVGNPYVVPGSRYVIRYF